MKPELSFCTTCKNRLYQIRQTLRKNLDDNACYNDLIEFILVDFGSSDGLHEWIVSSFQSELASGYLKYYYTDELPRWHMSIAKNTAHWRASGNILVNLDGDNYTGSWGGAYVMKAFERHGDRCVIHQFSGTYGDGSCGRIAVQSKYFDMIGGYDESFEPMGHDDLDLINRLVGTGLQYVSLSDSRFNVAIPNPKEGSNSKSYTEMLRYNEDISRRNLSEGRLIANVGKFGIRKNIFDHNGKIIPEK